jgi:phospholipase/carboxylesterase
MKVFGLRSKRYIRSGLLFLGLFWSVVSIAFTQTEYYFQEKTPAGNNPNAPLVLLLHGMGADEKDLWFMADKLPSYCRVVSLRAPYKHEGGGYRWFRIQYTHEGKVMDYNQALQSRQTIIDFLESFQQKNGYQPAGIYVIGFSQGAMMGFTLLSGLPNVLGHVSLGGLIFPELLNEFKPQALAHKNVFIGHGSRDAIVPVEEARKARQILQQAGIKPSYNEYIAGHQITPDMLSALLLWLQQKIKK